LLFPARDPESDPAVFGPFGNASIPNASARRVLRTNGGCPLEIRTPTAVSLFLTILGSLYSRFLENQKLLVRQEIRFVSLEDESCLLAESQYLLLRHFDFLRWPLW
jgi:hypothetical protein